MEEEIVLGRINRAVEKSLGIGLTGDVHVYGTRTLLDGLASSYPSCYLAILEEIKHGVFKKPDYAFYDEPNDRFYLVKTYCKKGVFSFWKASIVHKGVPKRWELSSFGKTVNRERINYVRVL